MAFIIRNYGLSPSAESISVREGCVIFSMKYQGKVSFCRNAIEFNHHGDAALNGHHTKATL